jgi:AcrR family transcriptional regulator
LSIAKIEHVQKYLDIQSASVQDLNMVKFDPITNKGEQTRRHIFECALTLFRENGFEATTMQQVADRAKVVKSAAYYYFPSKETIVQSYYEAVQAEQERLCEEEFARRKDLKSRLSVAMHSKFDIVRDDRKLLGVVFRYTGEPEHALSCLGKGTAAMRMRAMKVFERAIDPERLPRDLGQLLPPALWALQMGLLVMFLYDDSPRQQRTRKTADGALDLALKLLSVAKLPVLKPIRCKLLALLRNSELLPSGLEA